MWNQRIRNDDALLQLAQQGDREALDSLLTTHRNELFHYLCKHFPSLNDDDIEDAVQQTAVDVCSEIQRTALRSSFKSWLYSIAQHRCVDVIRKRRPGTVAVEELPDELFDDCAMEVDTDFRLDLQQALAALPPRMRLAFTYRLGGLDYDTIAQVLGTSRGNVASDIHRARERLEKFLQA